MGKTDLGMEIGDLVADDTPGNGENIPWDGDRRSRGGRYTWEWGKQTLGWRSEI